jgi:hypothetical protein
MKKIFFFTAISFLMLSSCQKEATTLSQDQTVAESQLQSNASDIGGAFTFNDVYTVDLAGEQFYNSCTNEQMTASIWNVLVSFHGIYNGNKSTIIVHSGTQRFKGVGEESGLEYIGAASRNYQESYFADGVFTTKLVYVIHAMTAGGGNNLIITETFYINVYADGTITYVRDPVYEVRCQ